MQRGTATPTASSETAIAASSRPLLTEQSWTDAVTSAQLIHHPGSWVSGRNSVLIKAISPTSENKVRNRLVRWLLNCLEEAGNRLFASSDQAAGEHGWQITRRHGGLSRRYRDPRFGSLISCPRCRGNGQTGKSPCRPCQATGRLTRPPPGRDQQGSAA
jgi:hypothetical protein